MGNGMERPNPLLFKVASPTNWHLPSTSTRIRSRAAVAADLQHPLKGVQGGDQEGGTLCSGKNWQNRSSERYLQEKIL